MSSKPIHTEALVFSFHQIREEGSEIKFREPARELWPKDHRDEWLEAFQGDIHGELRVFKPGSKAHVKGFFESELSGDCDRCALGIQLPLRGEFEYFLVPVEKDELGHKSWEPEDEDSNFSNFDGDRIDLRPLLRESLIMERPLRMIAVDENDRCLQCGKEPQ